jgi:hypothetical protein
MPKVSCGNSVVNTFLLAALLGKTSQWKKRLDVMIDNQYKIMEELKIIPPEND